MIVAIVAGLAVVVLITAACVKVSARWSRWEEQEKMTKQRKVLITITYNDMGIIVDTKAEEVAPPEIIRCKDCKWFNTAGCAIKIVDESDRPAENDFCSFAERKD